MKVKLISTSNNWQEIKNATMTTIGKDIGKAPESLWKRKLLFSEHSPIRKLLIAAKWYDLMYWVSVHIVRHKIGTEHFVRIQRSDRTKVNRNKLLQSALVEHEIEINAQSVINISRKRLCRQASLETREAWIEFLNSFKPNEPELYELCVPNCVYRNGLCSEYHCCGYIHTEEFEEELRKYINGMEKQINEKTLIGEK